MLCFLQYHQQHVVDDIEESTTLPNKNELIKMLSQIVNHPNLNQLFTSSEKVEVERKIITSKGVVLIPGLKQLL